MRVLYTLLLVLAASAAPAVAAEPADIPRVKTLAELEACEPADAGDGWSVRLGYGEPGEAAGGRWLVLYCLAEHTGEGGEPEIRHERVSGELLGPVSYSWRRAGPPRRAMESIKMFGYGDLPGRILFCGTLPANEEAEMRLGIFADGERELAGRTFEAPNGPRACYWHTFAVLVNGGNNGEAPATVVADKADAAYPLFGEMALPTPEPDAPGAGKEPPASLPGLDGAGDADGLRLSLKDGEFVVAADRFMTDWPDYHLLARWWVGGEPVVARVSDRPHLLQAARQVNSTNEMRVAFGLPDHLPPRKAGGKVALQLLYAPGGLERFQPPGQHMKQVRHSMSRPREDDAARPLLSNRLEFELTEDLLRLADNPKPDGTAK